MHRVFQRAWFSDWRDLLAVFVFRAGWSRTEALKLDDIELEFWLGQAERLAAVGDT
jgi:hypothetical protein